jgi:sortase A
MSRPRTRASKTRRWTEAFLLLAGVVALGIWGWSHVRMAVFQSWGNRVLDHRAVIAPKPGIHPSQPPPPIQNGALIGRLEIPRLNMRAVVREGAGQDTLDVALGHIPGTALPGQPGNAGIAGHRDTLFRGLRHIEKNDVIEFQTPAGTYNYKVENTSIVKPDDVAVLRASQQPELTLVTCYPFYYVGSAPDRFIVKARLTEPAVPAAVPAADAKPPINAVSSVRRNSTTSPSRPSLPAVRRIGFQLREGNSREVAPGIRLGLSRADAARRMASLWMFVTPERHSISLKNQAANRPVFFHGHDDGKQRELMITRVTPDSVTGYVLLYGSARAGARPLRSE